MEESWSVIRPVPNGCPTGRGCCISAVKSAMVCSSPCLQCRNCFAATAFRPLHRRQQWWTDQETVALTNQNRLFRICFYFPESYFPGSYFSESYFSELYLSELFCLPFQHNIEKKPENSPQICIKPILFHVIFF